MGLRNRGGKWAYRFREQGHDYCGATALAATKRNATKATALESEHRQAIREGRTHRRTLTARRCSDVIPQYLAWCATEHRDRPSTARRIAVSFASLSRHLGDVMVASVGAAEVEAYKMWRIGDHKVRDVTLRHDLHALSGFFQWCARMGYASENPVRLVKIPSDKDATRIHVLSADEEKRYFVAALADQNLHDFGRLLIQQGCRPAELLALTPADVGLIAGTAIIRYSKSAAGRRKLTLTAESRSILARRSVGLAPDARIFAVSPSGLDKKHNRALRVSGTDFVLYDLRHTFATRLATSGLCDLATLAAILGHSSLRIVQRYVHVSAEHQARAMRAFEAAQPERTEAVQ